MILDRTVLWLTMLLVGLFAAWINFIVVEETPT